MRQHGWMAATALAAGIMAALAVTGWAAQPDLRTVKAGLRGTAGYRLQAEEKGPGVSGMGAALEPGITPGPAVVDGVIQPHNLTGAEGADQLIVVVGTGGCNADTYYYKKGDDTWNLVWKEASIVGRGGITSEKAEGDGRTPAGTYGFTMAFGLKDDPGSVLPYHKIVKGDYWVDDSASAYYNKLVNTSTTPRTWNSAENLAAASPYYDYALALDYNQDCVPGKGSAIFLHCFTASADNGSAGCIRLPEARAKELVQSATGQTRIVIAGNLESLR
ncbi:L,D-transpeptidase family protein [Enterocloster sp. OA13]|uniref:L,D-transpeptidase family protein n=1 Tax=Enterocloster sp. OA13 TaxID=2914161 RepID=UPI001F061DB4|nr:L,D-transpeptidase family protein [Enterocloster sp. OA13]